MRVAMCLCGERFRAATTEDAWILLDAHCVAVHGDPFPRHVIRKGEYSTSRSAQDSRRRRNQR